MLAKWILISIVGSIVLTFALNVLPRLFPRTARRVQRKLAEPVQRDTGAPPKLKVYFSWKAMLIGSIVLTIIINLIGHLVR